MTQTSKKELDCIAMKRDVQNQIYEETKNLNPQQQMNYFRNAVKQSRFRKWWEEANSSLVKQFNKAS
jgi:chemotaxis regulatin CheY-phosphate phosphatase CheZ